MHVHSPNTFGSPKLGAVADFARRLAARLSPETRAAPEAGESSTPLTSAMLRAALLDLGSAADAQELALAEAFAHLGLPLTRASVSAANSALARAPGATPLSYALARAWALPTTPAALLALGAVTGENTPTAPQNAMPPELMAWLGLAVEAGMDPETMAAQLFVMAQGMGRSTESRVMTQLTGRAPDLTTVQDTRTTLLRLAEGSADKIIRRGADALARHIEGQQLINQAARRDPSADTVPFYCAVPMQFGEETALAEMRLWSWDDDAPDTDDLTADTPWLRATVRVATTRLGRVQADLTGTLAGDLTCRLGAEKPATARLLHRHASTLVTSLAALAGGSGSSVKCVVHSDWTPLWHGGDAMTGPRPCVDWRA